MSFDRIESIAHDVLETLWRSSWQAAVLAGVVLAVQWLLRDRLSARWRYSLWLLVLLRLIIPVTPQSPVSLFNLTSRVTPPSVLSEQPATMAASWSMALSPADIPAVAANSAPPPATSTPGRPICWFCILAALWLLGLLAFLLRIALATLRLSRRVQRMTTVTDESALRLLAECSRELGVRRRVTMLADEDLPAPALMGVLRPRLLLPQRVLGDFAPRELRLIFLHELAHLKRNDVPVNWLVALLQAIHWFNPVLWLAFARLRADRELATDELVLARAGDADRTAYGDTILRLLQSITDPSRPASIAGAGAVGILERAHTLRRRITMIAQFRSTSTKRWTLAAAACMLILAGLGLTDAVRGDQADASAGPPAASASAGVAPPAKPMDSAAVDPLATSRPSSGVVVAATATTLRKLASPAPEIRFDAIPFSDAVDFLRDVTDLNIFVNWRALESAGVDRNAPVTVRLKNVPYEQALHYMLRDVGGGSVKLDFAVVDGIVNIATEEALAEEVLVRVYNITRLLDAMPTTMPAPAGEMMLDPEQARREKVQAVVRLITETIAPDSWRSAGGAIGNIDEINGRLVVAQTEKNHAAIAKLLEEVSAGDGDSAAAAQK